MIFNSQDYIALLLGCVLLYWIIPNRTGRLIVMLLGSIVFYASWDWRFLPLLYGAIVVSYALVSLSEVRKKIAQARWAGWLALTVTLNLVLLGIFKYTNFLLESSFLLANAAGIENREFTPLGIILPLGISFFTFQLVAYATDVERGLIKHEKSLLTFSVFVSFFPQLIAGPICRGQELLPQLRERQPFSVDAFVQGLLMLAVGYLTKVGIADNLAPFVDQIYSDAGNVSGVESFYATLAFAVQIFCDFWGYSIMALGSAWLFGIMLPVNFNLPYIATSFQTFWRRWHMTLSFWLRDYLYITLGGNRKGTIRTYFNLAMVMILGGLWHGAAVTFLIWGAIHGGALAIERFISRTLRGNSSEGVSADSAWFAPFMRIIGWAITMFIVLIAWVFFRAEGVSDALILTQKLIGGVLNPMELYWVGLRPEIQSAFIFSVLGLALMFPLHWLNLMGNNQNFYEADPIWDLSSTEQTQTAIAYRPRNRLVAHQLSIPFPLGLKMIVTFWLFCVTYILSAQTVTPFIYFQF